MRHDHILSILVALSLGFTGRARAVPTHADSVPPIRTVRLAGPVVVDGLLNDASWQRAPDATRLVQSFPDNGAAPSESTWVWLAYDEAALYVAARCWDSQPDSVVARLVRRDVDAQTDWFEIWLDPYHDHRSGYFFTVTTAGVLYDGVAFNDGMWDVTWDGVWQGRGHRDDKGYTIEMRIPFSQLRFKAGAEQVWGVNFHRYFARRAEYDILVYTPRGQSGVISRLAHLTGLQIPKRPRSIELSPYVTGKGEYLIHGASDPFNDGSRYSPGVGADLRASVGNNLTLNATVNPDFGQVEVDPAVVNLSDVESYYTEKRPLFTENSRLFGFGNEGANSYNAADWYEPTFFYSRRIGRAPQGSVPPVAEYSDMPVAARMLGAAKLTGKLVEGLNVGTLQAVTAREEADYAVGGLRTRSEVEPLTYYGVARGLREFPGGFNGLGAMTTLVQRRLDGSVLRDALNEQSLMAGLDGWHFLDRKKMWVLSGWAAMSRVAGTAPRMIAVQRGPLHYLQRPDADGPGVDSSAASLAGYGMRVWLNKQEGAFRVNAAAGFMDPKFDVNDMGFQYRAGTMNGHVLGRYIWLKPKGWRKRAQLTGALYQTRNFDGDATAMGIHAGSNIVFRDDGSFNGTLWLNPSTLNDRRARGGPLMRLKPNLSGSLQYDSNLKTWLTSSTLFQWAMSPDRANRDVVLNPTLTWKPVSNLLIQAGPLYERKVEDAQYVQQVAAPGFVPGDFGGRRYVFARLDQETFSATIRLNISFTPSLSLETYLQPLISAGQYTGFKELARAGSYDFIHYGANYDLATGKVDPDGSGPAPAFDLPDPTFNTKSLRGNAVLRWEYRPGSVLYFVWTQQRTDDEGVGDLRLGPSTRRLFDAQANDIFLAKATYYLNL